MVNGLREFKSGNRENFAPFAFVMIFLTWNEKFRFLSMATPKYLTLVFHLMGVSSNLIYSAAVLAYYST